MTDDELTDAQIQRLSPIATFGRLSDQLVETLKADELLRLYVSYSETGEDHKSGLIEIAKMDEAIQTIVFAMSTSVHRFLERCDRRIATTILTLLEAAKGDRERFAALWRQEKPWFIAHGFIERDLPTPPVSIHAAIERISVGLLAGKPAKPLVDLEELEWAVDIAKMKELRSQGRTTRDPFVKKILQRKLDNPRKYSEAEKLLESRPELGNQVSIGED